MTTNSVSKTAVSSTRAASNKPAHRRLSKTALVRVKVATIALAVATFAAGVTGIALFNPQTGSRSTAAQAAPITVVQPGSSQSLVQQPPSITAVRPLVRSRGS